MRVELDKTGAWADIADVADLRDADRTAVNRAIKFEVGANDKPLISGALDDDMRNALLTRVVQNWSLGVLPRDDPDALGRLTLEQSRNLRKAVEPHMDAVREKDAPVRDNPVPTEG